MADSPSFRDGHGVCDLGIGQGPTLEEHRLQTIQSFHRSRAASPRRLGMRRGNLTSETCVATAVAIMLTALQNPANLSYACVALAGPRLGAHQSSDAWGWRARHPPGA
eukprot:1117367-Prymnesium_polylepis.1